jgi:integrase
MRVRLMKRKGKKGTTLFLRWWNNPDKKYVHEFMRFHLSNDLNRKEEDKELLRQAELKRIEKEQALTSQYYGIGHFNRRRTPLVNYFETVKKNKGWNAVLTHLKTFNRMNTPICDIDENWLKDFRGYLLSLPKVQRSSANRYYAVMKACLNIAYKEKVLSRNPSKDVEPISSPAKPVESLTQREVEMLAKEESLTTTQRAFLFACLCGLRYSDLKDLSYNHIDFGKNQILKTQVKTGTVVKAFLLPDALRLLNHELSPFDKLRLGIKDTTNRNKETMVETFKKAAEKLEANPKQLVFPDLGSPQQVNKELKRWQPFFINKRMHFHLSRSTFASLVYEATNDLYAVSKLLGHKRVATTEKYLNVTPNKLKGIVENSVGKIKIFKD